MQELVLTKDDGIFLEWKYLPQTILGLETSSIINPRPKSSEGGNFDSDFLDS